MNERPSFKLQINSIQDAERMTVWCLGTGLILVLLGLILFSFADMTIGGALMGLGALLIFGVMAWVAYASRVSSVIRNCPSCREPNRVFKGDYYMKCSKCGHFWVFGER